MLDDATLKLLVASTSEAKPLDARAPNWEKLERYSSGDFWGKQGEYWRGRKPKSGGLDEVQKLFTTDDQINPALDRYVSATVGKDPEWDAQDLTAQPDTEPSDELQSLEDAVTTWHKDAELHERLKEFCRFLLVYGRATLKVYVPDVYAGDVTSNTSSLAEALEFVHVLALKPSEAGAYRDSHGRILAHWHRYAVLVEGKVVQRLEVHTPEDITTYNLDGNTTTIATPAVPNPLFDATRRRRPRFMLLETRRIGGSLLTTSLLDRQDSLNESWTNLKRNDQLAGYRSIITTNAEDPTDDDGNPIPWTFGPARVQSLQGVLTKGDSEVPEGIATPGVIVVDPVNPLESSIPTIAKLEESLLKTLDQLWTQSGVQATSGESKRESRKAFDKRVIEGSTLVIRATQWSLETALALAANLEGQPDRYDVIRVHPKLFLDVERGNLELFKTLITGYERNVVSLETLVLANPGVEDAAAELQRLQAPQRLTPERADAAVVSGRMSRQAALENAGYDPTDAARIVAQALEEATMMQGGTSPPVGGTE